MASELQLHKALASAARRRILEQLRDTPSAGVTQLAAAVGLHPNTIRSHLRVLEQADLVSVTDGAPSGAGRPARRYHAVEPAPGQSVHAMVATVLADIVDDTYADSQLADKVRSNAHVLGYELACQRRPATGSRARVLDELSVLLGELGFDPKIELDGGAPRVVARSCPVRGLAVRHPAVACALHRGVTDGALAALAGPYEVDTVDAQPSGGVCTTQLRRTDRS